MKGCSWKLITLFASVTIAYSIESTVWSPTCSTSSEGTLIPHPGDCRKFFVCLQGIAYPVSCPYGLNWNPSLKKCTTLVACGMEQYIRVPKYNPLCPLDEDPSNPTHLTDVNDCGKFYECQGGFAFHMVCPSGQHWSVERESCEDESISNCKTSQTVVGNGQLNAACPTIDDPNNPTHLPHPDDCTKFYKCSFGRSYILSCLFGMHWDVDSNRCESPFIAKCEKKKLTSLSPTTLFKTTTERVTSLQPTSTSKPNPNIPICPSEGMKNFGIPGQCDKYFSCGQGKLYIVACREGREWSDKVSACVHADLAECTGISSSSRLPTNSTNTPTGTVLQLTSTTAIPSTNLPICPSEGIKNFGIPGQCDKYFSCSQGKLYTMACREGREWSEAVSGCVHPSLAECTGISNASRKTYSSIPNSVSSTKRPFLITRPTSCKQGVEVLPHPTDCHKFFMCSNGKPVEMSCPANLFFSYRTQSCQWTNIGC